MSSSFKMIFNVLCIAAFAVLHQQQARGQSTSTSTTTTTSTYCDYEIEYSGRDPEYVLTEVRRSAYRDYESVKNELQTADFGGDESSDSERQSLLHALETARYELDEYLNELYTTVLGRMRTAYAQYGYGDEYTRVIDEIWTDAEEQLRPRLTVFREHCSRPRSLLGGVLGGVGSLIGGVLGGASSTGHGLGCGRSTGRGVCGVGSVVQGLVGGLQ